MWHFRIRKVLNARLQDCKNARFPSLSILSAPHIGRCLMWQCDKCDILHIGTTLLQHATMQHCNKFGGRSDFDAVRNATLNATRGNAVSWLVSVIRCIFIAIICFFVVHRGGIFYHWQILTFYAPSDLQYRSFCLNFARAWQPHTPRTPESPRLLRHIPESTEKRSLKFWYIEAYPLPFTAESGNNARRWACAKAIRGCRNGNSEARGGWAVSGGERRQGRWARRG